MMNIINKSVKTLNSGLSTIVNGMTAENSYKTEVDFCKFDKLQLEYLKLFFKDNDPINLQNESFQNFKDSDVLYIVHSKVNLNIYHITEDLELKCFISVKFNFGINLVHSLYLPFNSTYSKELPILGLISNFANNSQITNNDLKNTTKNNFVLFQKSESYLKFYSIKSKRIIHNLRFKKKILQFKSNKKYFAISFADGKIKLFDHKMKNFYSIMACENYNNLRVENSYVFAVPIFDVTDAYILYHNKGNSNININSNLSREADNIEFFPKPATNTNFNISKLNSNIPNLKNETISNKKITGNKIKSNLIKTVSPIKQINSKNTLINDYVINSVNYTSHTITSHSLENIASDAYKNISKLKDWSLSQVKDFSNLRNASNFNNNTDLKESNGSNMFSIEDKLNSTNNSCTIILQKIIIEEGKVEEREGRKNSKNEKEKTENLNSNTTSNSLNSNYSLSYANTSNSVKINIPFFEDGISFIKFFNNGRYFIVANKNSQMFFLYELYPQSNLKYTKENDSYINTTCANSIYNFKISYSIYRGMTSATINTVCLSKCKKFITIGSNKGTFHIFNLPKRDNQIVENSSNFDYANFDEINQKVICAKDLEKIKMGNFLSNYIYKTTCKIINYNKIDINKNFSLEMKENLIKTKFNHYTKGSILYTFSENDPSIHVYYLNKNHNNKSKHNQNSKSVYLIKKLEVNYSNNEEIDSNYNELIKTGNHIRFHSGNNIASSISKIKSVFKDLIEIDTTDKNFSNLHNNPLFSFNITNYVNCINSNTNFGKNKENTNKSKLFNNSKIIEEKNESELSPTSSTNRNFNKKINIINNYSKNSTISTINILRIQQAAYFNIPGNNLKKQYTSNYKSRSNSISIKYAMNTNGSSLNLINNQIYNTNNPNNLFINDVNIHEKTTCQELVYSLKKFNLDKKIIPLNDFNNLNENYLHPKLIVYPSNYYVHPKKKKLHRINSSISDNSSSVENSISLTGNNVNNEIVTTDSDTNRDSNNNTNFYQNKDQLLKIQLKKDIESNIVNNFKKNENVVKIIGNFNIDDNYYVNK